MISFRKRSRPEDLIEHQASEVNGVEIQMQIQGPVVCQQAMHLHQSLVQETEVLLEGHVITVVVRRNHFEVVGPPTEPVA